MSYGAPVQAPMAVDTQPLVSQYSPELADVPKVDSTSANSIRLQSTLTKRMPSIPDATPFSNVNEEEAAQYANDMRAVFDITKGQNKRSAKISEAKNERIGKFVERSSGLNSSAARKLAIRKEAHNKAKARRNAADMGAYHLMRPLTQGTVFAG